MTDTVIHYKVMKKMKEDKKRNTNKRLSKEMKQLFGIIMIFIICLNEDDR